MSVQRFDSYGYMPSPEGKNMRYADHARIVAEAAAQAREAAYREMTDERHSWPGPRGFDYDKGYEQGKADAEQAHAAALAEAEHATAFYREVSQLRAADARAADARAAAPRTLTAEDRPDYKWDQEEVDDLRRQGYERGLADARAAVDAVGRWRSFPDDTLLSRAAVLAAIDALIHDEEATPSC